MPAESIADCDSCTVPPTVSRAGSCSSGNRASGECESVETGGHRRQLSEAQAFRHMISAPNPVGFGTCRQIRPAALVLTSLFNPYKAERAIDCCLGDRADFTEHHPAQVLDPFNARHGRLRLKGKS